MQQVHRLPAWPRASALSRVPRRGGGQLKRFIDGCEEPAYWWPDCHCSDGSAAPCQCPGRQHSTAVAALTAIMKCHDPLPPANHPPSRRVSLTCNAQLQYTMFARRTRAQLHYCCAWFIVRTWACATCAWVVLPTTSAASRTLQVATDTRAQVTAGRVVVSY